MQYRPRHVVLAAIALVISLSLASSTNTVRASESCETLNAWARTFADKSPSPSLAELTALDRGHQRAIFSALAPAARVSLWLEHLAALAQRTEFTAAQRAAAAELREALEPGIYAAGSPSRERVRAMWKAREGLFPQPEQRRAFLVLGAAPIAAPAARQIEWCNCSPSYGQIECYPLQCGPPAGCFRQDGCGFAGTDECRGLCF